MAYELEVRRMRRLDVGAEEVMTLKLAAEELGLSPSAVSDLMARGVLRRIVDLSEPNSRKAGRVLRVDVEDELRRRKVRRKAGDARLRGLVE